MRSFTRFCAATASCFALVALGAGQVQAQRGGSGGGGGGTIVNTATPFVFDYVALVNGATPTCSGDFTVTNSIPGYYTWTTVSLSVKAKSLNFADGTVLNVTLYTSDKLTGKALAPIRLAGMTVLQKVGILKAAVQIANTPASQSVRQLDRLIVTASDGTVVFSAHP